MKRKNKNNQSSILYQGLEDRRMLAGFYFDPATDILYISGTSGDDIGSVQETDDGRVLAFLQGEGYRDYATSELEEIVFLGFAGDDIFANETSVKSSLYGHDGDDTLIGGTSGDNIVGGRGNDALDGNDGDDRLVGADGNDGILGGAGNDRIFGTSGENSLFGEAGNDVIYGSELRDIIDGGDGADWIFGLGGDDLIYSGDGGVPGSRDFSMLDFVIGGNGDDEIICGGGANVVYGSSGNDRLIGGEGENRLHGQAGNDVVIGGSFNDYLTGGIGSDTIRGNGGDDFIIADSGNDLVEGGDGFDIKRFNGTYDRYRVEAGYEWNVADGSGRDGINRISGVDRFQMADGTRVPTDNTNPIPGISQDTDDQLGEAISYELGSKIRGRIDNVPLAHDGDVDSFRFYANSTDVIQFEVTPVGSSNILFQSSVRASVAIFDIDGNLIRRVSANAQKRAELQFSPGADGTYFVAISGNGNTQFEIKSGRGDAAGDEGEYILATRLLNADSDDQLSEADGYIVGATAQGAISHDDLSDLGDVDIRSFAAKAGQTVEFSIGPEFNTNASRGLTVRSFVNLFDSDGNRLRSAVSNGSSKRATFQYTFEDTGTYFIGVSGNSNRDYNPTTGQSDTEGDQGKYVISSKWLGTDFDDQVAEALPFEVGTDVDGELSSDELADQADVDLYRIAADSGDSISLRVGPRATTNAAFGLAADTVVSLLDISGNRLKTSSADGNKVAELSYTFTTNGDYFLAISGKGNTAFDAISGTDDAPSSEGEYRITSRWLIADGDDQISESTSYKIGDEVFGSIDNDSINDLGDVDMRSFEVEAGRTIAFSVSPKFNTHASRGLAVRSFISIFDSNGERIRAAVSDGATKRADFQFTFDTGGTYYFGISGNGNRDYDPQTGLLDTEGDQGEYLFKSSMLFNDDDDQLTEAVAYQVGNRVEGELDSGSLIDEADVDLFKFSAQAGDSIDLRVGPRAATNTALVLAADTVVSILDSNGTKLITQSADGVKVSEFTYSFPSDGEYFLAISGKGNTGFNPTTGGNDAVGSEGDYAITSKWLIADRDDQISEAVDYFVGTRVTGSIDSSSIDELGDVDIRKLSADAGEGIRITVAPEFNTRSSTALAVRSTVTIFDQNGTKLVSVDADPTEKIARLEYIFPSTGNFFIAVSGKGNDAFNAVTGKGDKSGDNGSYAFSAAWLPTDNNDQISEALEVNVGDTFDGQINNFDIFDDADVDMYRFNVTAGQTVGFRISPRGGGHIAFSSAVRGYLRLFNSDGQQLEFVGADPATKVGIFSYEFAEAGEYYLGVSGSGNTDYDPLTGEMDTLLSGNVVDGDYRITLQ